MTITVKFPKGKRDEIISLLSNHGATVVVDKRTAAHIRGLKQSLKEVKLMQEGKIPMRTLREALGK